MKKNKILLVGGCGFIGHNLAIYLKRKGHDILTIDNFKINNLEFVKNHLKDKKKRMLYRSFINERIKLLKKYKIPIKKIDATNKQQLMNAVKNYKPDILIHLAAVSHDGRSNQNPELAYQNSFRTLFNSLESVKFLKKTHFIFLSSSMVYGNFKKNIVDENEKCRPIGLYGSLKLSGELLVKSFTNVFSINHTIIRPSALYGERCISNRVIQIFLENAFQRKRIVINGNGKEKLDFTYIDDLCQGIFKIIKNKDKSKNQTFNLTYGSAKSIIDLKKLILNKFQKQNFKNVKRNNLMAIRGTLSIKKAKKMINYNPKYGIANGFEKYYQWYKNFYGTKRIKSK